MSGYQVTLFTPQDRRQGHQPINEWLMELAQSPGMAGSTAAAELFDLKRAVECGSVGAGKRKP